MPSWIIALLMGVSVAAWSYSKLARLNGNAVPRNNLIAAVGIGFVVFIFILSLTVLVLGF